MSGFILVIIFLLLISTETATADAKLKSVRDYCFVVEQRIVGLAEAQVSKSAEMARYAADQATADVQKFNEARDLLKSFSESLKENEEEWSCLGCAQILYSRSSK